MDRASADLTAGQAGGGHATPKVWPASEQAASRPKVRPTGQPAASAPSLPGGKADGRPATLAARLPQFPWDTLAPAAATARAHPGGIVDLSIGTPVDPVPELVRAALASASDSPGYPLTRGTSELRAAAADWLERKHGVLVDPDDVLPVIGTKELIASLPTLLGCGPRDAVSYPELAYPTYDIGARLAGARPIATDEPGAGAAAPVRLAWINSPSNPTGRVLAQTRIRALVRWARQSGAVLASDECYLDLGFEATPVSALHPGSCDESHANLIAVYSLSKRSNLAGYRAGFITGDPGLITSLLEIRKQAGLIVPAPVQAAMTAALGDDSHAETQHARYAARRDRLRPALAAAGWAISHSEAGLYLWASHPDYDCWESVKVLADAGILVAPGEFYGQAGHRHVRVALTATDERIDAAAERLRALA
jgi:succinyldiaminopimelate transaminase